MKRLGEPIEVEEGENGPRVLWRGGRRVVVDQVLERWVVQGRWWAREERRVYYRVATRRGVVEIYRSGEAWRLSRVVD